jgi:hypothetical protein
MMNALICLTQQRNLDALTDKIIELTDTVERIAAGQYNDRISMFYEARQTYIEAMAMTDLEDRRIALRLPWFCIPQYLGLVQREYIRNN